MKNAIRLTALLLAIGAHAPSTPAGDGTEWTLKSALKQMDKANLGVDGIRAEVQYAERTPSAPVEGEGRLYVSFDGRARADIGGRNPRTFLAIDPWLYVYYPDERRVEKYDLITDHNRLVQYALIGFMPAGNDLKKRFDVTLLGEATLGDSRTLRLELLPKKKEFGGVLKRILLWVDTTTWMPAQQKIYHSGGETDLTVRYLSLTADDDLPDSLFEPVWPEGTESTPR